MGENPEITSKDYLSLFWGGSDPSTSFDCSGFVSWVLVNSGVKDVGRLGATSLYGALTPVREDETRPGDIIFFEGTLGEGVEGNDGITHCGIYVGDGMMIHCGSPISYADLSRSYWRNTSTATRGRIEGKRWGFAPNPSREIISLHPFFASRSTADDIHSKKEFTQ